MCLYAHTHTHTHIPTVKGEDFTGGKALFHGHRKVEDGATDGIGSGENVLVDRVLAPFGGFAGGGGAKEAAEAEAGDEGFHGGWWVSLGGGDAVCVCDGEREVSGVQGGWVRFGRQGKRHDL